MDTKFLSAEGAQSVSPTDGPAARALWEAGVCPRGGGAWRFSLPALRTPGAGILGAPGTTAVSWAWVRHVRAQDENLPGGGQIHPQWKMVQKPQVSLD